MDHEALRDMKVSELKIMCKGMGLRVSGSKSELISRIMDASIRKEEDASKSSIDDAINALLDRHDKHIIEEGIETASAIGDDRLQQRAGRRVQPETFTHGSAKERSGWFLRGLEGGELSDCDTLSG